MGRGWLLMLGWPGSPRSVTISCLTLEKDTFFQLYFFISTMEKIYEFIIIIKREERDRDRDREIHTKRKRQRDGFFIFIICCSKESTFYLKVSKA